MAKKFPKNVNFSKFDVPSLNFFLHKLGTQKELIFDKRRLNFIKNCYNLS